MSTLTRFDTTPTNWLAARAPAHPYMYTREWFNWGIGSVEPNLHVLGRSVFSGLCRYKRSRTLLPLFTDEVDDADVLLAGPDDADGAVAVIWGQQGLPVGWRVHEVLYALVGELHIAQVMIDRG